MASSSAATVSRSFQHLLRHRVAASAPVLSAVADNLAVGRSLPFNPIAHDPASAASATDIRSSNVSIDISLFGRVDRPALPSCEQVKILAKYSLGSDDDFDSDDADVPGDSDVDSDDDLGSDDEDIPDDSIEDEDEDDYDYDDEIFEKPTTKSRRS